jgi:tagatose 6-phosphate kinase
MILTVTLNAALDVTYAVDALVPHATHRVREVHARGGGKGVNVARVLAALGEDAVVTGLAGGATGLAIRAGLAAAGLADATVPIAGESRRTVTVVADGDATVFNEPGPHVTAAEWRAFTERFTALAADADAVALSGSLPRGLPADCYAGLVRIARAAGAWTLVDTGGEPLHAALAAEPDAVTPNAAELARALPRPEPVAGVTPEEALAGAEELRAAGARAVVVTLGVAGMVAVTDEGAWRARSGAVVRGNPTGAGDACVAALVAVRSRPWPERIRDAVALSAAAVLAPVAGAVDLAAYRRLRSGVVVEGVDAAGSRR